MKKNLTIARTLPNDKFFDKTKLKIFADNKPNVAIMMISLFDRLEKTVGKGENAGSPAFSPFATVFSKVFIFKVVKSRDCVAKS